MIGLIRVGTEINLKIVREGKIQELQAKIAEKKSTSRLGKSFSDKLDGAQLTLSEIESRDGNGQQVIVVTKLEARSAAASAGLRGGDIILSVNKIPVEDFKQFEKAIAAENNGLLLNIQRGQRALFLLIR